MQHEEQKEKKTHEGERMMRMMRMRGKKRKRKRRMRKMLRRTVWLAVMSYLRPMKRRRAERQQRWMNGERDAQHRKVEQREQSAGVLT